MASPCSLQIRQSSYNSEEDDLKHARIACAAPAVRRGPARPARRRLSARATVRGVWPGERRVSLGAQLGLCGVVMSLLLVSRGVALPLAIGAALVIGILAGALNGAFVAYA